MTKEQILSMKPGRELDALVAEKVMEWKTNWLKTDWWEEINPNTHRHKGLVKDFKPSADIAAAWEVAEQLQKQGYVVCIELLPYEETSVGVYEADPANQIAYAKSNKPAEAICKAALLAVMGTVNPDE